MNTSKYDSQRNLLTMNFDSYILGTGERRVLDMFSETHTARTYSISEMKGLLEENGFLPIAFYIGELNKKALNTAAQSTFRVTCVAMSSRA